MRTRTSYKNQKRLWKELCGEKEQIEKAITHCCFNCKYYPSSRNYAICNKTKIMTRGRNERNCYE
jgi:hypothetical protein